MNMDSEVTLAILAGGESSRMKSPKANLVLGGRPILCYLLDEIGWTGPTLLINAPGKTSPPGIERFDREVFDPVSGLGPLRGILTALENARTQLVIVVTVDMPCVRQQHLAWVVRQLIDQPKMQGILMTRIDLGQSLIEPFPSIYRRSAAETIAAELAQQNRAVRGLLNRKEFVAVQTPGDWDVRLWTNLTTPQDVTQFRQLHGQ